MTAHAGLCVGDKGDWGNVTAHAGLCVGDKGDRGNVMVGCVLVTRETRETGAV